MSRDARWFNAGVSRVTWETGRDVGACSWPKDAGLHCSSFSPGSNSSSIKNKKSSERPDIWGFFWKFVFSPDLCLRFCQSSSPDIVSLVIRLIVATFPVVRTDCEIAEFLLGLSAIADGRRICVTQDSGWVLPLMWLSRSELRLLGSLVGLVRCSCHSV